MSELKMYVLECVAQYPEKVTVLADCEENAKERAARALLKKVRAELAATDNNLSVQFESCEQVSVAKNWEVNCLEGWKVTDRVWNGYTVVLDHYEHRLEDAFGVSARLLVRIRQTDMGNRFVHVAVDMGGRYHSFGDFSMEVIGTVKDAQRLAEQKYHDLVEEYALEAEQFQLASRRLLESRGE